MQLQFATCRKLPRITEDDAILARAFGAIGVEIQARPWQEIVPVRDAVPVLLRSTWDYYRDPERFAAWLGAMDLAGVPLLNPARTALGNLDKVYLRDLARRGFPIPRTRWVDQPDRGTLKAIFAEERWTRAVIKPRISATSHGTLLVRNLDDLSEAALDPARSSGGLIQEYLPAIEDRGELSLIFLGGAFSHAIRKRPAHGDFRVQVEFGGESEPATPPPAALALGHSLLSTVPPPCPYARVDLVESGRGPLLMEMELIEPELFFRFAPDAAARLATQIRDLLVSRHSDGTTGTPACEPGDSP